LLAGALVWSAAFAADAPLQFGADPAAASWQFAASQTDCRLSQEVPDFGEVSFDQAAGEALRFNALPWRSAFGDVAVDVSSVAPPWHPAYPRTRALGTLAAQRRHELIVGAELSEAMLQALYQGEEAVLSTPQFRIALSAVGFRQHLDGYARCVAGLLPTAFAELQRSVVQFAPGSAVLDEVALARLEMIGRYVGADGGIAAVFVDGHTDSAGNADANLQLSEQRARAVAAFLEGNGCRAESVVVRFHGARYPITSNATQEGRAQNRRTTIRLERDGGGLASR
jgi:outer membrane protein OmpA-like peptidoglycan-associated protein